MPGDLPHLLHVRIVTCHLHGDSFANSEHVCYKVLYIYVEPPALHVVLWECGKACFTAGMLAQTASILTQQHMNRTHCVQSAAQVCLSRCTAA